MAADDNRGARTASRAQAAVANHPDRFDSGRNPGSPEGGHDVDREGGGEDDDVDQDELDDEGEDGTSSDGGGAKGSEPGTVAATPAVEDDRGQGWSAPPQTAGGKSQASFVHKVWAMLEDPSLRKYIAWSEDGKSFLVFNPSEFAREVLPRYFKHSNFSSFLRQCNFYNWSKVNDALSSSNHFTNPDGSQGQAWEFRNPSFQRGRPDLLARIKRKTAKSSAANNSTAAARRRGSVTVTAAPTSRASKRDLGGLVDGAAAAAQALQEERTADAASSTAGYAGSAVSTPNVPGGPTGEDYVTVPKRVAAGLAEFAPYNGEVQPAIRLKEENTERPSSTQQSPPNSRHPAPHPSHVNHYSQPQPAYSPGTRPYPLPNSYSTYRYTYGDDQLARQVHYLEGQIRSLADALHFTQQESAAARATSYNALQSLIGVIASLDPEGRRTEELQAVAYAVAKLNTDVSPSTQQPNPFGYASYAGSSWPPSNGTYPFSTPRPSTSASQFYYNRVPAVESYTRTSRPDSRPDPAAPAHPHHPAESAPYPPPLQPDAGRAHAGPSTSSEQATSYPSPRLSWGALNPPTSSSAHPPPPAAGSANDKVLGKTTSLPPLSALLNPAGGPPSFGGRRAFDAAEESEPAAKKQRQ
ncbi:heat shock transcription factor [Rhodotorula toruloides]|uniref:Heat shock transcription factor n=1 Tax=Rhodotorula toruloides TaxID=5286 RepID=A0A511KIL2_RHOTO|nr:heat shock transcription factor [Rhodotorula toruloides]